jgi:hypothetical protein
VISLQGNRSQDTWDKLPKLPLKEFTNLTAVEIHRSPTVPATFDYFLGVLAVDLLEKCRYEPEAG